MKSPEAQTLPLFSLIIPNYNNGKYISEAIESILNQTYQNFEIIIVDDASSDNSEEIIQRFAEKYNRIRFYKNTKNKGVGYTKKIGVQKSNGEIVGTMGADDKLEVNAIEIMVSEHIKNFDASLIYSTHYICNPQLYTIKINKAVGDIPQLETYLTFKKATSDTISSFRTFKRKYYDITDGFSAFFIKAVDKDIIYKLEEVGETHFIDQPLYFYRQHEGSISLNRNAWKAVLWEVRAKEKAYYRRLNTNIPNLTLTDVHNEYYNVYKNLALDTLGHREYIEFLKTIISFGLYFKSFTKAFKLLHYCIKKTYFPQAFLKS